jgi:hypothetical protein
LDAVVYDPDSTVPEDVTISVSGPGGFSFTFSDADYYPEFNSYAHDIPGGPPTVGEYTFTVTDNQGKTAVSSYYFKGTAVIPLPNKDEFAATNMSGNSLTPTLSWTRVSFSGNLFYRARILDYSDNVVWGGWFTADHSQEVPPDALQAGVSYKWQVEVFDNHSFWNSDNRAISEQIPLVVNNSDPFFTYGAVYNRREQNTYYSHIEFGVSDVAGGLPGSVSKIEVRNPGGALITTLTGTDYYTEGGYFFKRLQGMPSDGVYSAKLFDAQGIAILTTYDYVDAFSPVPPVEGSSFQYAGDPTGPEISWSAPAGMNTSFYYRVKIFRSSDGGQVFSTDRFSETYVRVPSGTLSAGVDYNLQLRLVDDSVWGHYSNQFRLNLSNINISAAIDNSKPFIRSFTAYKRYENGQWYTTLDATIVDPNGTVPGSIQSIAVTGPGGFSGTMDATDYDPVWKTFFKKFPGKPTVAGVYVITATDADGKVAVNRDYFKPGPDYAPVDIGTVRISDFNGTTAFSWREVSGYPGKLYYRLIVVDSGYMDVVRTSRELATAQAITPGTLQPGKLYRYRIEAYDHRHFVIYNTRVNTDWTKFKIGAGTMSGTLLLLLGD